MNMVFIGLAVASTAIAVAALFTKHWATVAAALGATYAFLAPVEASRPHASIAVPLFIAIAGLQALVAGCNWMVWRHRRASLGARSRA